MPEYQYLPIEDDTQFEKLVRDLIEAVYGGGVAQLYGRSGQAQDGIDGTHIDTNNSLRLFQCKKKDIRYDDPQIIPKLLKNLRDDVAKVPSPFQGREVVEFIFAHTYKHDTRLDDGAIELGTRFPIRLWSWDVISDHLNTHRKIAQRYYPSSPLSPRCLTLRSFQELPNFQERDAVLEAMERSLQDHHALLLYGIGGIGKSSVAHEYLHRHHQAYDHYGVINGREIAMLGIDMIETLHLSTGKIEETILALRQITGRTLLLIDDLHTTEHIENILSLTQCGYDLIFTSREKIESLPHPIEVLPLSHEEARSLFGSICTRTIDETTLDALLGYLDGHAYFIDITAKTLERKHSLTPKTLLETCRQGNMGTISYKYQESYQDLLNTLFDRAEMDSDLIYELQCLALLPPIEMTLERLSDLMEPTDLSAYEDQLIHLADTGWLIHTNESYKLHQITQEYIKKGYPLTEENADIAALYTRIGLWYRHRGDYALSRDLYHKALAIHEKHWGAHHPHTATSYNNLALLYHGMGAHKEALELNHKALAIHEKHLGAHHPHTAISYNNLAEVYHDMGAHKEALELHRQALAINEKLLGENHPNTIINYYNLGMLYYELKQCHHAQAYLQKVYDQGHPHINMMRLRDTLSQIKREITEQSPRCEAREVLP